MGVITGVDYATFNDRFFQDAKITWFNRKGVKVLDSYRRAEIELVTNGVADNYAGYRVEIIHKERGRIATHTFLFGDYFDDSERIDLYPNEKVPPHIDGNICKKDGVADWYINQPHPEEIKKMAKLILQYIELYL